MAKRSIPNGFPLPSPVSVDNDANSCNRITKLKAIFKGTKTFKIDQEYELEIEQFGQHVIVSSASSKVRYLSLHKFFEEWSDIRPVAITEKENKNIHEQLSSIPVTDEKT